MSVDPKRRMRGIPRAGDLYVNGVKTAKGNQAAKVRRIYKASKVQLAETHQPGPMEFVNARDLEDDPTIVCQGCGDWFTDDEIVTRERATGRCWHMGSDCRQRPAE